MKCPLCQGDMVESGMRMEFFDGEIILNPVSCKKCTVCGEELITPAEYERIRLKVNELRKCEQKAELKAVIAFP